MWALVECLVWKSREAGCHLEACNVAATQLRSSHFFAAIRGGLQFLATEQILE